MEVRQSQPLIEATRQAIYLRGSFINRYAAVEFSLSTLLVFAADHDAYRHLGKLPYSIGGKLKRFHAVLDMDGPLSVYASSLKTMHKRLTDFEELRAFIAHAIMVVEADRDEPVAMFRLYRHPEGEPMAGTVKLTFSDFRKLNNALRPIAQDFPVLVAKIGRELDLIFNWPTADPPNDHDG